MLDLNDGIERSDVDAGLKFAICSSVRSGLDGNGQADDVSVRLLCGIIDGLNIARGAIDATHFLH